MLNQRSIYKVILSRGDRLRQSWWQSVVKVEVMAVVVVVVAMKVEIVVEDGHVRRCRSDVNEEVVADGRC
jgi:hypothetical protein